MVTYLFQILPKPLLNWQKMHNSHNNGNNNNHSINNSNKIWAHIGKENRKKIAGRDDSILVIPFVERGDWVLSVNSTDISWISPSRKFWLKKYFGKGMKIERWLNKLESSIHILDFILPGNSPLMSDNWKLLSWKTTLVLEEVVSEHWARPSNILKSEQLRGKICCTNWRDPTSYLLPLGSYKDGHSLVPLRKKLEDCPMSRLKHSRERICP